MREPVLPDVDVTKLEAIFTGISTSSIIVFDGHCVLCSRAFRFVVKHDKHEKFQFLIAQTELGEKIYAATGRKSDDFDTNLVFINGKMYERLDAFAVVMREIGGIWKPLSWVRVLPENVKNLIYFRIARNRYRLFGRTEACMVPTDQLKARFIGE